MKRRNLMEWVLGKKVELGKKYSAGGRWKENDRRKFRLLERMSVHLYEDE